MQINSLKLKELGLTVDFTHYKLIEEGIYQDLSDKCGFSVYRMPISVQLLTKDCKKLIERELENAIVYIEYVITVNNNDNELKYIIGGDIEDIRSFKSRITINKFIR